MELIALTGAKGSGKNTAFLGIEKWSRGRGLRAVERGFADMLKWSAARLFWPEISREQGVAWGNSVKADDADTHYEFHQALIGPFDNEIDVAISGRTLLQRYGTESHRNIFGKDFWVDQLLPVNDWESNFGDNNIYADIAVITDLRFENEAQRVKDLGGAIWEIQRPGQETSDSHASEQPLPRNMIDKVIVNSGRIEDLLVMIESAMDGEYHLKFLTQDPA